MADERDNENNNMKAHPPRKEELERAFERWERERPESLDLEPEESGDVENADQAWVSVGSRYRFDLVHLMMTLTLVMVATMAFFMFQNRHQFDYWANGGDSPQLLGDLREQWREGDRSLDVESNRWVSMSGVFTTHDHIPSEASLHEAAEAGRPAPPWYFVCPLFDIVVQTGQKEPDKPYRNYIEIEEHFLHLVKDRRAFPRDLAATMTIEGRLLRFDQLSGGQKKMFGLVARDADLNPKNVWILLDGQSPRDYQHKALFWALAPLVCLVPLGLWWHLKRKYRA